MKMEWSGRATCRNCSINYSDIEPELIIKTNDRQEYVICPSCLKLIQVTNTGDDMAKSPVRINHYNVVFKEVLNEISSTGEEGEKRAKYIMHSIRVMRAKNGLARISF